MTHRTLLARLIVLTSLVAMAAPATLAASPTPRRGAPGKVVRGPAPAPNAVVINGAVLNARERAWLERTLGSRLANGRYWYDPACGAWGVEGQGTAGFVRAGLPTKARLRADASHGRTGVFINGRQLTRTETAALGTLGPVIPGRYWMDASGNLGVEGGPALVNLATLARSKQAGSRAARGAGAGRTGRAQSYRSWTTDTGVMSDGNGFVGVIGDGWSVTVGD